MCKAVQDMMEKASEKKRIETLCANVKNAMGSFKVGMEDAMKALKISKEDQAILKKMI